MMDTIASAFIKKILSHFENFSSAWTNTIKHFALY